MKRLMGLGVLMLCAAGCQSGAKPASADTWELKGSRIIACCCPSPCP